MKPNIKSIIKIAIIYLVFAKLSGLISSITGFESLLALHSGFALAILLVTPTKRALLGIFFGSILLSVVTLYEAAQFSSELSWGSFIPACVVTIQAYINLRLYRLWLGNDNSLSHDEQLFRFLQVIPLIGVVNTFFSLLIQQWAVDNQVVLASWYQLWIGHTLGLMLVIPVVLSLLARQSRLWHKRKALLLTNFIISLVFTYLVCLLLTEFENTRLRDQFKILTNQTATLFQVSLSQKRLLQESVAQLFLSSEQVTRKEFQQFVKGLSGQHKNIQVVEWLPRITNAQRERYEQEQRNYYGSDFSITQIKSKGKLMKATNREVYFPITYIEPELGNEIVQGFDPSVATRSPELIQQAILTGKAHAREPVQVFRKNGFTRSFIVYRPVFNNKNIHISTAYDGNELLGFVNMVVRVDDFINHIVGPKQTANFDIQWQDNETNKYYFQSKSGVVAPFQHVVDIKLFERDMKLIFTPTEAFLAETATGVSAIAMVTSFLLFGLLSVLVLNITARTLKIQSEVKLRTKELEEANLKLEELSNKDVLTQLYNRRYFEKALATEFERAQRYGNTVALVNFDIDNFKNINDQFGHPCGDEVIKSVADYLISTCRSSDVQARVGGEEFALILPVKSEAQAASIVERIRIDISNIIVEYQQQLIQFTCSFGIAILADNVANASQLINMADQAMYKAKRSGKNTVVLFSDL